MTALSKSILAGFDDYVRQSQQVFRAILEAMSQPGRTITLTGIPEGPPALSPAASAACLSLVDVETPLWLDRRPTAARDFLRFHCGCQTVERPDAAAFAVVADPISAPDFTQFNPGIDEHPETAATVILEVTALSNQAGPKLLGPGIRDSLRLEVQGTAADFWRKVR